MKSAYDYFLSFLIIVLFLVSFYRIGIKTVFQMSIDDVVKITLINIELSLCFNLFMFFASHFHQFSTEKLSFITYQINPYIFGYTKFVEDFVKILII